MGDGVPTSRAGSQFGPYLLRRLIDRGVMGEAYEAEDTRRDRTVALKLFPEAFLRTRCSASGCSARRVRSAGWTSHTLLTIHDYGEIDGVLFVDMRWIDGTPLREVLVRYGPLAPARAAAIIR